MLTQLLCVEFEDKTAYFIFPKAPSVLCYKWYLMSGMWRMKLTINVTKQSVLYPRIKVIYNDLVCISYRFCNHQGHLSFKSDFKCTMNCVYTHIHTHTHYMWTIYIEFYSYILKNKSEVCD